MPDALAAFAVAFGVVALAELGDKSQLLVLAQAARQPAARVLAEAVAAFALLTAVAATAGALAARVVPGDWLALASGLLFLAFAALAWRDARRAGTEAGAGQGLPARRGTTFGLLLVAEMGDKTQLATAALAASSGHALATGLGALLAESAMAAVAVAAGAWLARRVDERRRAAGTALLFLAVGLATIAYAVWRLAGA